MAHCWTIAEKTKTTQNTPYVAIIKVCSHYNIQQPLEQDFAYLVFSEDKSQASKRRFSGRCNWSLIAAVDIQFTIPCSTVSFL